MNIEVVLLGPQKQPSYCYDHDFEQVRWYKICYNSSHRVGDGMVSTFNEQCAFGCPRNLEVYGGHSFIEEDGCTLDNDLVSLEDWIGENCQGLMEIYDE